MKRRDFLKGLVGVLAAAAAPAALVGQTFKWKRSSGGIYYKVNPEWMAAKYEVMVLFEPATLEIVQGQAHPIVFQRLEGESIQDRVTRLSLRTAYSRCTVVPDTFPVRLDGDMNYVHPVVEVSA